jgi:F-type H+-transporting ATPase subunit gamma
MASIKDLKKRIQSTKNTQQTTKAMKMVSAAYLRRAQDAIASQRPYAKAIGQLMGTLRSLPQSQIQSPYFERETTRASGKKKLLLLVVTSDRGLCGGFNANIIKGAQRFVKEQDGKYESITLSFLGKKGFDFFKTKKYTLGPNHSELAGKVTFAKAKKVADFLVNSYVSGEFDEVKVIYNLFRNAITQETTIEGFLPIVGAVPSEVNGPVANTIVKPDVATVLTTLLNKNFGIQAFRIMLESQAGEHGARMSAMENATKNAGEMIFQLTLDYNKQRQAGITKELLEIIAGSESQKAG